ncbi:hypothetical protein CN585_29515 [Bacillus toyonensis]|uniref:Histidine kinase n=1 Tax=Bacillus toyonensis TaxID=155322 RepID=A0A2A8H7L8_9BACI|nr:hypothetical protein CN585_29515 [Bacillus toyonensis]
MRYTERCRTCGFSRGSVKHALNKGREEGVQKGLEQGVQQGKHQMILGMHRLQVPIETIAKANELTIEEVKNIIEQA